MKYNISGDNGGAVANRGDIQTNDTILSENQAKNYGGALYNSEEGTIILENSFITNNNTDKGGGIYKTKEDNVKKVNSQVKDNYP